MTQISAKIIADSISHDDIRLVTMELVYPRFIHSEFMTHRVLSKNSSSSRAIPTAKLLEQVRNDPMMPVHWGKNQAGMQAHTELTADEIEEAKSYWYWAAEQAALAAEDMLQLGVHKQIANRVLEPFVPMRVVVSGTKWANFFHLRGHPDAQPEIQELARCMEQAMATSMSQQLSPGQWHLPYIRPADTVTVHNLLKYNRITRDEPSEGEIMAMLLKISVARCARVSYNNFEGKPSTVEEDLALYNKLVGSTPLHASPTEHQATPDSQDTNGAYCAPELWGNFHGWIQHRKLLTGECITD